MRTEAASPRAKRPVQSKLVAGLLSICCGSSSIARAQEIQIPLIRGPGVGQEQIEAVAEANGRTTLADQLDSLRPGGDMSARLHRLVERAQNTWLSGSIENARSAFREISHLALEADWRPAQREAIHYAFLRLAQSASTSIERDEWLQKAVTLFPDLVIEEDTFPPPLTEQFHATRTRVLALSHSYAPYEHFPDYRYLLVNGRRFAIVPDLKIRLPNGPHRITAMSDAHWPVTEKLSISQLEAFRISRPTIATGSCEKPQALDAAFPVTQFTVVYGPDCMPTKTASGWIPSKVDAPEGAPVIDDGKSNQARRDLLPEPPTSSLLAERPPDAPPVVHKTWIWIGLAAVVAGAAYALQSSQKEAGHDSPPKINPVHRTGM